MLYSGASIFRRDISPWKTRYLSLEKGDSLLTEGRFA